MLSRMFPAPDPQKLWFRLPAGAIRQGADQGFDTAQQSVERHPDYHVQGTATKASDIVLLRNRHHFGSHHICL